MNVQWSLPGEPRPSPRALFGRTVSAVLWIACSLAAVAVYTNVMADDTALREEIDALAREHVGCRDDCRVTRMVGQRSVIDYRTELEIDGQRRVEVLCRRSAIVVGVHVCRVR